jgi:hypothetical protein
MAPFALLVVCGYALALMAKQKPERPIESD